MSGGDSNVDRGGPVLVRTRADLVWASRVDSAGALTGSVVVKDPVALKYWLLREHEVAVLKWLKETISLKELQRRLEERFFPRRTSPPELQSLIGMFYRRGLLVSSGEKQSQALMQRSREQSRQQAIQWLNPLMLKFPGVDPGPWLDRLMPLVAFVFSPWIITAWFAYALVITLIVWGRRSDLIADIPAIRELFTWQTAGMLMVSLTVTKVLHELGHALTCARMGTRCHEIGVAIFFFSPCLFCDTTDSWMVPQRWRRIAIAMGGMVTEFVFASFVASLWILCGEGPVRQQLFYLMMTATVFSMLINLNPLLRYDGYFVLSDWVGEPNLAARAKQCLSEDIAWLVLGPSTKRSQTLAYRGWHRIGMLLYALSAMIYRWFVIGGAFFLVWSWFESMGLQGVGGMLVIVALAAMTIPFLRSRWKDLRTPRTRRRSKLRYAAGVLTTVVLAAGILIVPIPYHVVFEGRITTLGETMIYTTTSGRIEGLKEPDTMRLSENQELVTLTNPDLAWRRLELEQKIQTTQLASEQAKRRQGSDATAASAIESRSEAIESLLAQKEVLDEELLALKIKTMAAGKFLEPPQSTQSASLTVHRLPVIQNAFSGQSNDSGPSRLPQASLPPLGPINRGGWLAGGTFVGRIATSDRMMVVGHVSEDQLPRLSVQGNALICTPLTYLHGQSLRGKVINIATNANAPNPSQKASEDAGTKRQYEVRIEVEANEIDWIDQTPATVRVRCGWRSLLDRLSDWLGKVIEGV